MNKNSFSVLLLAGIFFLLLCANATATTYYVKNSGDDKASGTSDSNAWRTIAKVNSYAKSPGFKSGDVIQFKRGDVWKSDQSLGDSVNWGTSKTITVKDYGSGDKPWFNANTFQPINISGNNSLSFVIKNLDFSGMDNSDQYVLSFTLLKNLTIDGIYMDAHYGASRYPRTSGILIGRITDKLEVMNSTLKNFVHPSGRDAWGDQDAHGIYTSYAVSGGKTSGSYVIHNNVIGNVQADCIQLKGIAPPSTKIYGNEFYKYGENALDFKNCANVEIYNNDVHSDIGTEPGGTGGGIWDMIAHYNAKNYGPHCNNITIRDNRFHDSDYGSICFNDSASNLTITRNVFEKMSAGVLVISYDDVEISNNAFMLTNAKGLMESAHKNAIELGVSGTSTMKNVVVKYNTIYGTGDTRYGIRTRISNYFSNFDIQNNLIYLTRSNSDAYPLRVEDSPKAMSFYKNTLINASHSNRVYMDGSVYDKSEQSQWRNNYDTKGLFAASPLFTKDPDSGDLTLSSSSPALGTGTTMTAPYTSSTTSSGSLEAPFLEVLYTN